MFDPKFPSQESTLKEQLTHENIFENEFYGSIICKSRNTQLMYVSVSMLQVKPFGGYVQQNDIQPLIKVKWFYTNLYEMIAKLIGILFPEKKANCSNRPIYVF